MRMPTRTRPAYGPRMDSDQHTPPAHSTVFLAARLAGAALALGLFAAAMWSAWLGWDHEYYQVNGVAQGPYRTWQVVGCGVSIAVVTVAAYLWLRGAAAIFVLAAAAIVGFAVPWTMDAASTDDTGLFGVGLIFILVGGGMGLVVLLAFTMMITDAISAWTSRRTRKGQPIQG